MLEKYIKATTEGITVLKSHIFTGKDTVNIFPYRTFPYLEFKVKCDKNGRVTGASLMMKAPDLSSQDQIYTVSRGIKGQNINLATLLSDWRDQILKNIPSRYRYRGWISIERAASYRFVIFDPNWGCNTECGFTIEGSGAEKFVLNYRPRLRKNNPECSKMERVGIITNSQLLYWWDGATCDNVISVEDVVRRCAVDIFRKRVHSYPFELVRDFCFSEYNQCPVFLDKKCKTKETNNMKKTVKTDMAVKQTEMPQERVFVSTLGWIYIIGEKTRIHRNKCSDLIGFLGTDGNYYEVAENLIKVYVKENYNKGGNKEMEEEK